MSDNYRALIEGRPTPLSTEKPVERDDPAHPEQYLAIRRIFSFDFHDVLFRRHTGAVQAFPWIFMRGWLIDETGSRLTLIWPEMEVSLTGLHLDKIEMDLQRRIIAEFRQIPIGQAEMLPEGTPVIMAMSFEPVGQQQNE